MQLLGTKKTAVPPELCTKHLSTPLTQAYARLIAAGSGTALTVTLTNPTLSRGRISLCRSQQLFPSTPININIKIIKHKLLFVNSGRQKVHIYFMNFPPFLSLRFLLNRLYSPHTFYQQEPIWRKFRTSHLFEQYKL